MQVHPLAKINIGLRVIEKRNDGYHNIETLFYPVPLVDDLEIRPLKYSNAPYLLQLAGHHIEGKPENNLVVKIFEQLRDDFPQIPPTDIYLYKRIPSGAGLGGGSSDAAFMLKMLNEVYLLQLSEGEMEKRVARLGADCAFFIKSMPAIATGIGDILTPCSLSLKGWFLVLVKPEENISTAEAYGNISPHIPSTSLRDLLQLPVEEWKDHVVNDFEQSVFPSHPNIAAIKQTLYDMGAVYASMSGSGSSVFGLFRHRQESAIEVFKDCFVFQAKLLK